VYLSRLSLSLAVSALVGPASAAGQTTPLLDRRHFQAIRHESSGELPLVTFREIETRFTGFTPSRGGDRMAEYLAGRMRDYGLADVGVEGFPADGRRYFWTFLTEPAWDAETGTLTMVSPRIERLADYLVTRVALGRFSSSADVTSELVDVGAGTSPSDYEGKDVRGKIALVSGEAGAAHALAVWRHGAAGIVWSRSADGLLYPHLVSNPTILPWTGPTGEAPGFAFGVSYATGLELRDLLHRGQRVELAVSAKATTGPGEYRQVNAVIAGSDPTLPEVWVNAHDNYRNTGGGNNLTGVGATVEIARVLQTLIARGDLPRPRRSIRFLWGAEHFSSVYNFHAHPEKRERVLAFLNVDMVGYHQERVKAVFHVYRLPHSMPHFLSDVAEEFMHAVGRANAVTVREAGLTAPAPGTAVYDPTFAPTGSRDQLHYAIDEFWGPSDHEDVVEASIGVPAVLYNDWPDPYIGTQEDDITRADPTQMRRAVMTVAATAYSLASIPPERVPTLAVVMTGYAGARLATEGRRAFTMLEGANPPDLAARLREALNVLDQARHRERQAIRSLDRLGDGLSARAAVARAVRQVEGIHAASLAALRDRAAELAAAAGVKLTEPASRPAAAALRRLVPIRADSLRGPVHFFRPEYGAAWLRRRTGDDDFRSKVRLARRGHYVLFEALSFADGTRSVLEIRDAVSAEYGPVPVEEVEEYFRFLERVGVVSLRQTAAARSPSPA
jgi:hypothetical protein